MVNIFSAVRGSGEWVYAPRGWSGASKIQESIVAVNNDVGVHSLLQCLQQSCLIGSACFFFLFPQKGKDGYGCYFTTTVCVCVHVSVCVCVSVRCRMSREHGQSHYPFWIPYVLCVIFSLSPSPPHPPTYFLAGLQAALCSLLAGVTGRSHGPAHWIFPGRGMPPASLVVRLTTRRIRGDWAILVSK